MSEKMPRLPNELLDLMSEYGMARTDGVSDVERLARWARLIDGIKGYAAAALAAQPSPAAVERKPLRIDLPDRVVDVVAQHAGLLPPFSEYFYDFAQALKDEIIARIPSSHAITPAPAPSATTTDKDQK
jgi:hypothetical protein